MDNTLFIQFFQIKKWGNETDLPIGDTSLTPTTLTNYFTLQTIKHTRPVMAWCVHLN
jgi:hypothetical protein